MPLDFTKARRKGEGFGKSLRMVYNRGMPFSKPNGLRVLFLGTPDIAARVLSALLAASFDVRGVVTQEDKPRGRKGKLSFSPVKEVALGHDLPVFQPHRIRNEHGFLSSLEYDVIVCIAYGQILPLEVLESAPLGAYNLHASILPKYRGAAPMQRALWNGEKETGVALMKMGEGMDDGNVHDLVRFPISPDDNLSSLTDKTADAASRLIVKDLLPLVNGLLPGVPQNPKEMTLAPKILPEDERLSLSLDAPSFHNRVRALSYIPGAYLYLGDKKIKILRTKPLSDVPFGPPGALSAEQKRLCLSLEKGAVEIVELQLEGGKRMPAAAFLNGHPGLSSQFLSEDHNA